VGLGWLYATGLGNAVLFYVNGLGCDGMLCYVNGLGCDGMLCYVNGLGCDGMLCYVNGLGCDGMCCCGVVALRSTVPCVAWFALPCFLCSALLEW
jgi:hypothetical protein